MPRCYVAGFFLVDGSRGQMGLYCSRPVDELFLTSMQKRLVSSYQACIGPGAVEPEVGVTVYGHAVPGPYEPPRSLLTAPVLDEGRVIGLVAVASVLAEAFSGQDLCALSTVAAQVPGMLAQSAPDERVHDQPL
jgi:GAF domain-containing protein